MHLFNRDVSSIIEFMSFAVNFSAHMEQLDREAAARGMTVWSVYSALTQWSSHATDQFKVRNTGADNVAAVLADRETAVTRIVSSEAWQRFAA